MAAAGGAEDAPASDAELPRSPKDLDGVYVTLGPVASAVLSEDVWDGGFGAEVMLVRIRERDALAGFGVALGGVRFASAGNGRIWGDLLVGTKRLFGVGLGVSAGVAAEVGDTQAARLGWQATLWAYGGVIPYARVGTVETSGTFAEIGVKIALPTLRW